MVQTNYAVRQAVDGALGHVSRQVNNTKSHIDIDNDIFFMKLQYVSVLHFVSYDSIVSASDVDGEVEEPPNPDRCWKVKKTFEYKCP